MSDAPKRPTLADVAREAGTSTAVVSYVVNNGPRRVAEATRVRVQAAITALGYRRNSLAGALSVGRTNLVGLLVPDSSNAFFSELARHVEVAARERGYLTLLGNTNYDREVERGYESAFSDVQVAAIFVVTIDPDDPVIDHTPRIYLHSAPEAGGTSSVLFDDEEGARLAVQHLIGHGHTEIHCVTSLDDFGPTGRRARGWATAMAAAGLSTAGLLHRVPMDRIEAETALRRLLAAGAPPAIFATTDEHALAVLRAAALAGVRIPEQTALVGFDGIREALLGSVRLTTVAVSLPAMAERVFDHLAEWTPGAHPLTVLPPALVVGETCGC
ncbi:LacI family DNA-binding transcriptional regulator [Cryobacterium sp. SO2]|uniref:LacI family DNA-binding transcriptional regulator n=1 Tax=Cryobacterium sp. SO2 TaxID=1897060 RepID=UPI00223DC3B2|nr:LacI family DNA-binding transcriptional regulator [Cryobacterium sp. SO2]WEO76321.1 LacI family DNA-binding transcriptional regulator [Cryobacterium sp. SO2]